MSTNLDKQELPLTLAPVTRTHQVVHGDLVLHVLGELGVDVREGVSRVGGLGGGGAGRVVVGLDGGQVGEEGEGIVVALVGVSLDTDGDLLVELGLVWTGLRREEDDDHY